MNTENLEELGSFIQEDIFLLKEDRDRLRKDLSKAGAAAPSQASSMQTPSPPPAAISRSEVEEIAVETTPIQIRGNFSKGILVVHEEAELAAEVMDMLVKMINACGHSMNEIGMLSSEGLENRSMEEFTALNAHTVLKFGRVKHLINSIPAQHYEVFADGEVEYLFADSLSLISEDKNLKKKLWTTLQKLFNLTK